MVSDDDSGESNIRGERHNPLEQIMEEPSFRSEGNGNLSTNKAIIVSNTRGERHNPLGQIKEEPSCLFQGKIKSINKATKDFALYVLVTTWDTSFDNQKYLENTDGSCMVQEVGLSVEEVNEGRRINFIDNYLQPYIEIYKASYLIDKMYDKGLKPVHNNDSDGLTMPHVDSIEDAIQVVSGATGVLTNTSKLWECIGKKGNTNDLFRKTINRFYELTSSSRLHDQLDSCLEYHK